MIESLRIKGFKRFKDARFDIAPLTVLAGLNGSGKTSIIHSILLAREASSLAISTVRLNGPFNLELGSVADVRHWEGEDDITIALRAEGRDFDWRFGFPSDNALYLAIKERPQSLPREFSGKARNFTYLCAERLGPRSILGVSAAPIDELEIGVKGEFSAQLLSAIGDKPLSDKRRLHPERHDSSPAFLKYEMERWLSEIVRPIETRAEQIPESPVTLLSFRSPGGEWVRAPNMGFGVSYSLPIVLAGLTNSEDSVLIVENPEAHLHPAGQSRIGVFLAWLASRGVQVILETHSDHVLNGIRRAIGEHKFISHSLAKVIFFQSSEEGSVSFESLDFTPVGGISHWPKGFFDQYQVDVAALGKLRRGH